MANNVDFGLHMHLDGADQAAAGIRQVDTAASSLEKSTVRVQQAQASLASATAKAEAAQAAHAKALADSSSSQDKITAASTKLAQAQAQQAAAAVRLKDASAQLQQQTAGLGQAVSLTANQAQQLGFQLNDLFVQIASGGSPLTALIQQGSQLSGTFGGVGNTIKALSTVFTPVRLAAGGLAAALGTIALATVEGDRESKQLARTLALTGNAAQLTEGRFNAMARSIADNTKTSIGEARETLLQLAASGRCAGESIGSTGRAVQLLSKATGEAAGDIAKRFTSLVDDVSKGAEALNRQYHFLTIEQYKTITALERQGDVQGAVALTMDALSAKLDGQAQKLGFAERAWDALKRKISETVETVKSIGRDDTLEEKINKLGRAAEAAAGRRGGRVFLNYGDGTNQKQQLAEGKRQEQAEAQELLRLLNRQADAQGRIAQQEERRIAFDKEVEASMSNQAKLARDIQEARKRGENSGATPADIKSVEQNLVQNSAAFAQQLETAIARLQGRLAVASELAKGNLAQIQALVATGQISQIEGIERIGALETAQLQREKEGLIEQLGIARQRRDSEAEQARLAGQIATKQVEINNRQAATEQELAKAIFDRARATREVNRAQQEQIDQDIAAELARQTQEQKAITGAITDQIQALNDSVELFRLEQSLIASDAQTRQVLIEQLKIEQRLRQDIAKVRNSTALTDESKAAEEERLRQAAARAGGLVADRVAFEFKQRAADQIERDLENAIMEGGDAGKRYLENLFKRTAFDIFLRPIVGAFAGGFAGLANATGAAGGTGGGLGSAASLFSAGKSLYEGFASGFSTVGAQAAGFYDGVLAYSGSTYGTAFGSQQSAMLAAQDAGLGGASAGGSAFGTVASYAAGAAVGVYGGRAISGGYGSNSTVNVGTAVGAVVGSIVPVIGTAVGAAVGGLIGGVLNRAFGRRAPELESQYLTGSFSGSGNFTGSVESNMLSRGGWFRSDKRTQTLDAVTGDLDKALDEGAGKIVELAKRYGAALGLPVDKLADVNTTIRVELTDKLEENADRVKAALSEYADALLNSFADDLEPLRQAGETVAQTIERVGGTLVQVNDVFKAIGVTALNTSLDGGKAAVSLEQVFGGLDNLRTAASAYYDAMFTEEEKAARSTKAITDALAGVGLAMPTTRQGFRDLVEAQAALGVSGQKAFAVLLSVAGAFGQLQDAADVAAQKLADEEKQKADKRDQERAGLQGDLYRALGDTAALRRMELEALDPLNRNLQQTVWQAEDAATALEKATAGIARFGQQVRVRGPGGVSADVGDFNAELSKVTRDDLQNAVSTMTGDARDVWQSYLDNNVGPSIGGLANSVALNRIQQRISNENSDRNIAQYRSERSGEGPGAGMDYWGQQTKTLADEMRRLRESLTDYLESLRLGDLSTLSPEQKYLEAKAAFEAVAAQSSAGDPMAREQLRGSAQSFLQLSKAYNGPGGGFVADFSAVEAALNNAVRLLDQINGSTQAGNLANAEGLASVESATTKASRLTSEALARLRMAEQRGTT